MQPYDKISTETAEAARQTVMMALMNESGGKFMTGAACQAFHRYVWITMDAGICRQFMCVARNSIIRHSRF